MEKNSTPNLNITDSERGVALEPRKSTLMRLQQLARAAYVAPVGMALLVMN